MVIVNFYRTPRRGILKGMKLYGSLKFPGMFEANLWINGVKRLKEYTVTKVEE